MPVGLRLLGNREDSMGHMLHSQATPGLAHSTLYSFQLILLFLGA